MTAQRHGSTRWLLAGACLIVVLCDHVEAADCPTILWHDDLGRGIVATPILSDDLTIVALADGNLVAVNVADRRIEWKRKPARSFIHPAVVLGEHLYVGGADVKDDVLKIEVRTGRVIWRRWVGGLLGGISVVGDAVVAVTRERDLACLDCGKGDVRWRARVQAPVLNAPVGMDTGVLVPAVLDSLYRLHVGDGGRVWGAFLEGGVAGSPVAGGDTVFVVGQTGSVAALDAASGEFLWRVNTGDDYSSGPVYAMGSLFLAGVNGRVTRIDSGTGRTLWSRDLNEVVQATPAVSADAVVVGTLRGRLWGLSLESGEPLWDVGLRGAVEAPVVMAGDAWIAVTDHGDMYILGSEHR